MIGPIGNILISAITAFIKMIGEFGAVTLGAVISASMAFDLGGPINKTALALSMQLNTDAGVNAWVPAMIGAVIPAIGVGLATIVDKAVFKKRYLLIR